MRLEYITSKPAHAYSAAERQLDYTRQLQREDLVRTASRNLPAWATGNPYTFFQAAELYDQRQDADVKRQWTAFEEWKIMLPHELTREHNEALIEDLLNTIAGDRLPYTYAFHDPKTMDGAQPQPHIHLLISARMNDEYSRTPAQHFQRWNSRDPSRGGARKDPSFSHLGAVRLHRLMISDMVNLHLERHGKVERVHPETLKSRGIEREPEPRLTPKESGAYRTRRFVGETMGKVLGLRQSRTQTRTKENNQAYQAWEERKVFLGIDRAMPHEEKLTRILLKRHGSAERLPLRYRTQAAALERPSRQAPALAITGELHALLARLERGGAHQGHGMRVRLGALAPEEGREW